MCGRYSLYQEDNDEIREILERTEGDDKTGEIFPTDKAPVLIRRQNDIRPEAVKWGFPGFRNKGVIINARAETIQEKTMFRKCLPSGRCIIPSTGFFEWSHDKNKQKYRFDLPGTGTLYMAGLFNNYSGETNFVIITTGANESMADIHNRMPVVLNKDELTLWLGSLEQSLNILKEKRPMLLKQLCG